MAEEGGLPQALRDIERGNSRQALADEKRLELDYLKNTVLKLYETGIIVSAVTLELHHCRAWGKLSQLQARRRLYCRPFRCCCTSALLR